MCVCEVFEHLGCANACGGNGPCIAVIAAISCLLASLCCGIYFCTGRRKKAKAKGSGSTPEELSCLSKAAAKLAPIVSSTEFIVMSQLCMVGFAIASVWGAVTAYNTLNDAFADFNGILVNWGRVPIVGFAVVDGASACPSGYSKVSVFDWPGASTGDCACESGAMYDGEDYYSSSSSCSTNQTKAGCEEDPSIAAVDLDLWRGGALCYLRAGEAYYDGKTVRPTPGGEGDCPSGYHFCGVAGKFDSTRGTCQLVGEACPATSVHVMVDGETTPAPTPGWANRTEALDGGHMSAGAAYAWASREDGLLPIVEVEVTFAGNKRGPCYSGDEQTSYASTSSKYTYDNDVPSQCDKSDDRYALLDSLTESKVLYDNFLDDGRCTSCSDCSDYIATSYECGSNPGTDSDCQLYNKVNNGFNCRSLDSTCENVLYQSKCGALQRFASRADSNIGIYVRRQIMWTEGCSTTAEDVEKAQDKLNSANDGLYWIMIVNGFCNFFVGMIFPGLVIYNAVKGDVPCIPGRGDAEKVTISFIKKWLGLGFKVTNFVPSVFAVLAIQKIAVGGLGNVVSEGCSDATTLKTFDTLATSLPDIESSTKTTMLSNAAMVLYALMMAWYEHHKNGLETAEAETASVMSKAANDFV